MPDQDDDQKQKAEQFAQGMKNNPASNAFNSARDALIGRWQAMNAPAQPPVAPPVANPLSTPQGAALNQMANPGLPTVSPEQAEILRKKLQNVQ